MYGPYYTPRRNFYKATYETDGQLQETYHGSSRLECQNHVPSRPYQTRVISVYDVLTDTWIVLKRDHTRPPSAETPEFPDELVPVTD